MYLTPGEVSSPGFLLENTAYVPLDPFFFFDIVFWAVSPGRMYEKRVYVN